MLATDKNWGFDHFSR